MLPVDIVVSARGVEALIPLDMFAGTCDTVDIAAGVVDVMLGTCVTDIIVAALD